MPVHVEKTIPGSAWLENGASEAGVFADEIDKIVTCLGASWEGLRRCRIFITGGTGYFGRWLLPVFIRANERLNLGLRLSVLSRNPAKVEDSIPEIRQASCIEWQTGDVRNFAFPRGEFTHVIHGAATSAEATFLDQEDALEKYEIVLEGTRQVLDFAAARKIPRILMLSSGSFYGSMPQSRGGCDEDCPMSPSLSDLQLAMGHGKRAAEFLSACYADRYGFSVTAARCFSFVGPYLPLNIHYAVGNFIHDALTGESIKVRGDGSAVRSYLYTGDLMVWLVKLLLEGRGGRAYNVGSDQPITIRALAEKVRTLLAPEKLVEFQGNSSNQTTSRHTYLPNIERARRELGLDVWTSLDRSIYLTALVARTQFSITCE